MLVRSSADERNESNPLCVTGRGRGDSWRNGMPQVQQDASALARAAEAVALDVRTATTAL
jgi:hypothetical protein